MSILETIPEENLAWDYYYRLYYDDDDDDFSNSIYIHHQEQWKSQLRQPLSLNTPMMPIILAMTLAMTIKSLTGILTLVKCQLQATTNPLVKPTARNPFNQRPTSTPSGGEQIPMPTRTRLPPERGPRTAETFFGGEPTESTAWSELKGEFTMADESKLKARYKTAPRAGGGGGGAVIEVAMQGKDKWYRLYTKSPGDVGKSFNESLPKEIKTALGKSLDEQFNDTNAALQEKENELVAKQKQLERAAQRAAESQKLKRDMDALTNQIKDIDAQIQQLEDEHGPLNEDAIQKA